MRHRQGPDALGPADLDPDRVLDDALPGAILSRSRTRLDVELAFDIGSDGDTRLVIRNGGVFRSLNCFV